MAYPRTEAEVRLAYANAKEAFRTERNPWKVAQLEEALHDLNARINGRDWVEEERDAAIRGDAGDAGAGGAARLR